MTSLANADGGVTSTDEFWRVVDKKNRAIGKQRIGSLNKLFAHRYGGREAYVFPDDDAGVEDLKILLQHYRLNNPLRMPGIIQLRAPWVGDPAGLIEQIEAYPRKWRAETLGRELNFTGAEWKLLRLRTIAPIDMTHEGRRAYSQKLYLKRRRIKLRQAHRADYLAENNLSRTKPWVAEGICRRTWERRRAMAKPPRGMSQVSCNKVSNGATHLRQQGWRVE